MRYFPLKHLSGVLWIGNFALVRIAVDSNRIISTNRAPVYGSI